MQKNTRLVLDSNEFIFDFLKTKEECIFLISLCRKEKINIVIPTLVLDEVFRNIKVETNKYFASKARDSLLKADNIEIIKTSDIPVSLLEKYQSRGLKQADASIAAFVEWTGAKYLISENRDFLKGLRVEEFKILSAKQFLSKKLTL